MSVRSSPSAPLPSGLDDRGLPSVTVVIPTCDRAELVRRAVRTVVEQEYAGRLRTIVVFDRSAPDRRLLSRDEQRPVRVLTNCRTPGLAGARNTGILAAGTDLVAFCDDDDSWSPDKLDRQVSALMADPDAEFATTAMVVDCGGRRSVRLAGRTRVTHRELLRSRMAMLHSSSFLIRRSAVLDGIGLVDETIPQSMAEDWDLLLRASRRRPVVHVDEPLVEISWGGSSYFMEQWATRNAAQLWLLQHHPEMGRDRVAAGLSYGKLAFGCAAQRKRREAVVWAGRALRANRREPRAWIALGVASGVLPWRSVVRTLNRRGHGI